MFDPAMLNAPDIYLAIQLSCAAEPIVNSADKAF